MTMLSLAQAARIALLNPSQREFLEDSVALNKRAMRQQTQVVGTTDENEPIWGKDETEDGERAPNLDQTAESLKRDETMLKKYSPLAYPLKPYEAKKTWEEVQYLTELIQEGMPSDAQMDNPTAQNIDLHLRWTERNVNGKHPKHPGLNLVQARATRIRTLDPNSDDPNLTSIERIRPHTEAMINWRAYYAGYDELQFSIQEKVDAALEELDPDRFARFCQLKAADWTPVLIQKELGFTRELYEAAMARLKDLRLSMPAVPSEEAVDAVEARGAQRRPGRPPKRGRPASSVTAETVRAHLEAKGWRQADVARAMGMQDPAMLANWLGGLKALPIMYYPRLKKVLALDTLPQTPAGAAAQG